MRGKEYGEEKERKYRSRGRRGKPKKAKMKRG
jgi:hypothetical protein